MENKYFIEGVSIIAKYIPESKKNDYGIQASHDQIWFGDSDWVTDENNINRLNEIGWFIDECSWSATL